MPTVELPAHNISTFDSVGGATIFGGPEAIATRGYGGWVDMIRLEGEDVLEPDFRVGVTDDGDEVLGFGVWEQPAGSTVTSMQFVAEGYYPFERVPVGDDFADLYEGATEFPVGYAPLLLIRYTGDPFPSFGGYNLSQFPVGAIDSGPNPIVAPGQINLPDYVISPGGGDRGEIGLGPRVSLAGYPFPAPSEGQQVVLTYLAIRITYTVGPRVVPPRRSRPRHQLTTAARGSGGRDSIRDGPRGVGAVV